MPHNNITGILCLQEDNAGEYCIGCISNNKGRITAVI